MNQHKHATEKTLSDFNERFLQSLNSSFIVFGENAFKKIDSTTREPDRLLNRAVYDAVMVGFSIYSTAEVVAKKKEILELFITLPERDKDFADAITYGTSDKVKVELRLSTWCRELAAVMR
jgi:hypothetical protein